MTVRLTTMLLCILLLLPAQKSDAQTTSRRVSAWEPSIQVLHVTEEAGRQPSLGVEVILEQWAQSPRGDLELKRTQVRKTNSEGKVEFKRVPIRRGAVYVASTIRNGVTFSTPPISGIAPSRKLELETYEQTRSTTSIEYDVRGSLEIREEAVVIKLSVAVSNDSSKVIMADETTEIRAPMLLPAIGDEPWVGYFPTEKAIANIGLHTNPKRGVLEVRRGSVFFTGPILPGRRSQEWRLAYVIPIHAAELPIVLQSDKPVSSIIIEGIWANSLAPTISSSIPYESRQIEREGKVSHVLIIRDPPKNEGSPQITIKGLPYAMSAESNLGFFGGGFLFVLFLLFALGLRPKE